MPPELQKIYTEDLLRGSREIARFIGEPERRALYLLEVGALPAGRLGRRWVASRRRLAEFYDSVVIGKNLVESTEAGKM